MWTRGIQKVTTVSHLGPPTVLGAPAPVNKKDDGKPDLSHHGFGKAQSGARGQLVDYFQAVDRFKHRQDRDMYIEARSS